MKTLKIDVDDELLERYNTDQIKAFLKEQLKRLESVEMLQEMMCLSESSLGFWDNPIDDEAWNDI